MQGEGGFLAGVSLGLVPMGGIGHQLLDAGEVLPHGTPEARFGLSVGLIVGGIITTAGGITGDVLGGAATVTGIGAAVGIPAIMVSTTLVVGGVGNVAAGIRGLTQSMMSKGSGSTQPQEGRTPEGRRTFKSGRDAQEQAEDIDKAQRLSRNRGQPNRIERVEKSRQRLKNEMKRVREPSDADQEFGE